VNPIRCHITEEIEEFASKIDAIEYSLDGGKNAAAVTKFNRISPEIHVNCICIMVMDMGLDIEHLRAIQELRRLIRIGRIIRKRCNTYGFQKTPFVNKARFNERMSEISDALCMLIHPDTEEDKTSYGFEDMYPDDDELNDLF